MRGSGVNFELEKGNKMEKVLEKVEIHFHFFYFSEREEKRGLLFPN